jgi:chromatin remodeling complex protein RSC6
MSAKNKISRDDVTDLIDSLTESIKDKKKEIRHENLDKKDVISYLTVLQDEIHSLKMMVKKVAKKPREFKPVNISSELSKFASLDEDSKYTRVEIYKIVYNYVSDKELIDRANKSGISPDIKLKRLLGYTDADGVLKYTSIPKLLKRQGHFIDSEPENHFPSVSDRSESNNRSVSKRHFPSVSVKSEY